MATGQVFTATRMLAIEGASVVSGLVDTNGHLILTKHDSSQLDAGSVIGPTGATGPAGSVNTVNGKGGANPVLTNDDVGAYSYYQVQQLLAALVPSGTLHPFAGASAPSGYLLCDGSAISRTTYASLYSAIGTTYGTGDGSTTFNLPNTKGRVLAGVDSSQTEFATLAKTGGAKTHTHTLSDNGFAQVVMSAVTNTAVSIRRITTAAWTGNLQTTNATGAGTSSSQTQGAGLGGTTDAGSSLPPYLSVNYIIKT